MDDAEKKDVLKKAQEWFTETISVKHIINTKKLCDPKSFNINPFLSIYLANFLCGNSEPQSIAKALVYPRVLGTSITTSFGQNMQSFANSVLSSFGSTTSGIDIEFSDAVTGHKMYCQLKAGPNTINKDDVETIAGHFGSVIRLGKTNGIEINHSQLIVGVLYGAADDLSPHYKRITSQYYFPVMVGNKFWTHLTGDGDFYADLIKSISLIAREADFVGELEAVITELALSPEIVRLSTEVSGD